LDEDVELSLRPIGGIFLRLDASGNLTVYDSSGTVVAKFVGGLFSGQFNRATALGTPIVNTTSTVLVHSGLYAQITPQVSGNILAFIINNMANNTAGDGGGVTLLWRQGAFTPSAGSSIAGWTQFSAPGFLGTSNASNTLFGSVALGIVNGLINGQVYTIAPGVNAQTGGTLTPNFNANGFIVFEI